MEILLREYNKSDIPSMINIWNEVIEDGIAFPQLELLDEHSAEVLFASQSYTGVATREDEIVGLYILHPNNVGRCGHIANASYAVKKGCRGLHIGEKLVTDCLVQAKNLNFKLLQFNAVVATNKGAIHLYEKLGFKRIGMVPGGFLLKNGKYEDIILYYIDI